MPCSRRMDLAFIALSIFSSAAFADGNVVLDFDGDTNDAREYHLIVGSDDRIYVSGCTVVALDRDGTLISTFGSGGKLANGGGCDTHLLAGSAGSYSTVIKRLVPPQGPLVVGYEQYDATGALRFTATDPRIGDLELPLVLAQQPDGKMLLGGYTARLSDTQEDWTLRRFNTNGTLDTSFSGGAVVRDLGSAIEKVQGIQILTNGKLLVFGEGGAANDNDEAVLIRLNQDGTLDSAYGSNGRVEFSSQGLGDIYRSNILAVDSTGRAYVQAGDQQEVIRVNANGSVDSTFAGGAFNPNLFINSLALDSSGRTFVFGTVYPPGQQARGYISRFTASGAFDASFGSGRGLIEVDLPTSSASVGRFDLKCSGALQQSGKPVLACTVPGPADDGAARLDLAVYRFNLDGTLDTTFGQGQPDSDIYPDAFTFADKFAPFGTAWVVSDRITVSGINAKTSIEIRNDDTGAYSISCTDVFTGDPGTIEPGQSVCLRLRASSTALGTAQTTIRIGGRIGRFTVRSTSDAADTSPDAFTFVDQVNLSTNTEVRSNAVQIAGIAGVAAVTVTGGEYSIGCDDAFTSQRGEIVNGQRVCVRHKTSAQTNTVVDTMLTVGNVSDTFSSTTEAVGGAPGADTTPDAFSFVDRSSVAIGSSVTSNTVTVTGINTPATISVSNGEYSVGCTLNGFTTQTSTIDNGATVCVRHTSASQASTSTRTTLTIGGISGDFSSTTAANAASSEPGNNSGGRRRGGGGAFDFASLSYLVLLHGLMLYRRRDRDRKLAEKELSHA